MTLTEVEFRYIAGVVREHSAIQVPDGKQYLVEARLLPVARSLGLETVGQLVTAMRRSGGTGVRDRVVDAMTTNETWWFRDEKPFAALGRTVLPELVRRREREQRIAIWSAACSTGQEPYTIAMVAHQVMAARPDWRVEITATDLSTEALAKARAGRYVSQEVNRGLPAHLRDRYFTREGDEWVVREDVRSMVAFRPLNLAGPVALPGFDLVFLRNVLIYFDLETKRRVLAHVRRVLRADGYLFLGAAETTLDVDPAFERVVVGGTPCYRSAGGSRS